MSGLSMAGNQNNNMATPEASDNSSFELVRPPKVSSPETFDGTQGKLEGFQLQVQLYFHFNRAQFTSEADKVLYAASFLRGRAAKGFRPFLKDWLDNQEDGTTRTETRQIFHDYDHFEIKLNDLYGVHNEAVFADRHIRRLRQNTSVSIYASEFQGYAADLEWNDAALRSQFYLGLKEAVKQELSREKGATSLGNMIKAATAVDERLQDLKQDRYLFTGNNSHSKATSRDHYGPQPMDLDNTERQGRSKKRSEVRCYACQKAGHIARNCDQKVQRTEFNTMARRTPTTWE
jgi:hypothetical protein